MEELLDDGAIFEFMLPVALAKDREVFLRDGKRVFVAFDVYGAVDVLPFS